LFGPCSKSSPFLEFGGVIIFFVMVANCCDLLTSPSNIYAQEEVGGEELLEEEGQGQDINLEDQPSVEDVFNEALKILVNVEGLDYSTSGGAIVTVTDGEVTKRISLEDISAMLEQSSSQTSIQIPFVFNKGMIEIGEQLVACIRISENQQTEEQQQLQEEKSTGKPHCVKAVNSPEKKPEIVTIPL